MNIRAMTTVAASLAVIGAIVTTTLWRELRTERDVTAALRAVLDDSLGRINTAEAEAGVVARAATMPAPAPAPQQQSGPPAVPAPAGTGVSATGGTVRITEQELLQDPDYRQARLMSLRTTIRQTYPGLAEELGLGKEEADQLFGLLAQNQMDLSAQTRNRLTGDQQVDQAALAQSNQARQALQRDLEDSLQNMLGAARYRQWQDYQQTRSQWRAASDYASTLAQAGVPMDSAQNKALVQVLIAEQRNPQVRAQAQQTPGERRAQGNQRLLDAAAGALSPQQISVLRAQFEQQEAIDRAQQRVRERTEALRSRQ